MIVSLVLSLTRDVGIEAPLRMPERCREQRYRRGITTDHAIERHNRCWRNLWRSIKKIVEQLKARGLEKYL